MINNWYKKAFDDNNFENRNIINHKIITLEQISEALSEMSNIVLQDKIAVKNMNYKIIKDKVMSSYPSLLHQLKEADKKVLDNPWKFAETCNYVSGRINLIVKKLYKEREEETMNNIERLKRKGWWIDGE